MAALLPALGRLALPALGRLILPTLGTALRPVAQLFARGSSVVRPGVSGILARGGPIAPASLARAAGLPGRVGVTGAARLPAGAIRGDFPSRAALGLAKTPTVAEKAFAGARPALLAARGPGTGAGVGIGPGLGQLARGAAALGAIEVGTRLGKRFFGKKTPQELMMDPRPTSRGFSPDELLALKRIGVSVGAPQRTMEMDITSRMPKKAKEVGREGLIERAVAGARPKATKEAKAEKEAKEAFKRTEKAVKKLERRIGRKL